MCNHKTIRLGACVVCVKCGLTVTDNGKILLDRKLPNHKRKKGKGKKHEQKS